VPNRILKDSICTSETIDALSVEAERFFYRLMVQCDDFGRFDARPSVIRSRCFPLRLERITDKLVCKWIDELSDTGLLWTYVVDDKTYLQVTKWNLHQQMRAARSRYPEPVLIPEHLISSVSKRKQLPSLAPENPNRESESDSESESEEGAKTAPIPISEKPVAPAAIRVFLSNGGLWPTGKLADGTTKAERARQVILENVRDTPESLELWGKVVFNYCAVWSGRSYSIMVNDYYLRGKIPGHSNTNGSVPPARPRRMEDPAAAAQLAEIVKAEKARVANEQANAHS
jgi:hypothetical protein